MAEKTPKPVPPPSPPPSNLEYPLDLDTKYVNMVRIVHSPSEIIFDFAHILPGESKAKVQSRVLMSPLSAKLFHRALTENLAKYEAAFGEIHIPGEPSLADKLFRTGSNG
ncbi:MAG: DUF3467 domain-containing protein [Chloroflexota bacterium]